MNKIIIIIIVAIAVIGIIGYNLVSYPGSVVGPDYSDKQVIGQLVCTQQWVGASFNTLEFPFYTNDFDGTIWGFDIAVSPQQYLSCDPNKDNYYLYINGDGGWQCDYWVPAPNCYVMRWTNLQYHCTAEEIGSTGILYELFHFNVRPSKDGWTLAFSEQDLDSDGSKIIAYHNNGFDGDSDFENYMSRQAVYKMYYDEEVPNSPPTTGQISGPSIAQTGDPVNFYCNVYDNDGDSVQSRWNLGDGTITNWVPSDGISSIIYTYTDSGTYNVEVQPKDSYGNIGLWSSIKTITITGGTVDTIDITIGVKDSSTDSYLSDANVTINGDAKTTSSSGKTLFTLTIGTYQVKVSKEGYNDYSEIHSFSNDIELTIKLDSESFIPGFELISLLCAIGIIFIIFKRKIGYL